MTVPLTVAAAAPRATPGTSAGGGPSDSAAPFASALDGALAGGRGPVRDATCGGGQRSATGGQADGTEDAENAENAGEATAPEVTAATAGVTATLFAMALAGATTAAVPDAPAADAARADALTAVAAAPGVPAAGVPAPAGTVPDVAAAAAAAAEVGPAPAPAEETATGTPAKGAGSVGDGSPGRAALPTVVGLARAVVTPGVPAGGPGAPDGATAPGRSPQGPPGRAVALAAASGPVAEAAAGGPGPDAPAAGAATGATTPAPLPQAAGDADVSAGSGQPDQEPAVVLPAPTTAPAAAEPDAAAVLAGTAVAAPAPVQATAPATGSPTGPAPTPPVAGQVASSVAVLSSAGDGAHTMTLVLNPENLGPVEVQVTVYQGSLDLHLRGAHDLGRAALVDALPELRRDLEAAGLSPSRIEVDADTGGSWLARHAAEQHAQQGSGNQGSHQNHPGERSRSWGRPADSGEGPARPSTRSTSSGVDVLA